MIERRSAGHLLKFILAVFAAAVVVLLVAQVWYAWSVLAENRRAEQVVAASRQIFTAPINQRTDRSTTQRFWEAEAPPTVQNKAYPKALRDAEMPALTESSVLLASVPFAGKDMLLPGLRRSIDSLTANEGSAATTESAVAVKTAAASLGTQATRLREQVDGFMERIRGA